MKKKESKTKRKELSRDIRLYIAGKEEEFGNFSNCWIEADWKDGAYLSQRLYDRGVLKTTLEETLIKLSENSDIEGIEITQLPKGKWVVFIDTNFFVGSYLKQKLNYLNVIFTEGLFAVFIPERVTGELRGIAGDKEKTKERENAKIALNWLDNVNSNYIKVIPRSIRFEWHKKGAKGSGDRAILYYTKKLMSNKEGNVVSIAVITEDKDLIGRFLGLGDNSDILLEVWQWNLKLKEFVNVERRFDINAILKDMFHGE